MTRLARFCFSHKKRVIALWVVALIVLGGASGAVGFGYSDSFQLPGTESAHALKLLQRDFKGQSGDQDRIVWRVEQGSVRDAAVRQRIEPMLEKVAKADHVSSVDSPYTAAGARQISRDGRIAYATVNFDGAAGQDVPVGAFKHVIDVADAARGGGVQIELGGNGIQFANQQQGNIGEFVGIIAAAIILFIAFGSLFAMLTPLLTAIVALGTALSASGLLAHAITIATFAPELSALIGLGVGVDYALFIVTRHRNAIRAGRTPDEAIDLALDTSGRAVIFAGITVCIALLGLLVLGVSFLNGVAISASMTVLFTMAASVTLLPAFLGVIGMRVLSRRERRTLAEDGPSDPTATGWWARWARIVQRRPVPLAAAALVIMLALAIPALSLRLGSSDAGTDPPSSTTRKAFDLLATGFGPGFNGPLQVVAETPRGHADLPTVTKLASAIRTDPDVAFVAAPAPSPNGRIAIVSVSPRTAPQDKATSDLIVRLRDTIVPRAVDGSGVAVSVGGLTAIFDDFAGVLSAKLPLFVGVIVLLGCLLLMLAFRSVVVPLVAAAMNLLAAGAAFGVVTLVFQHGFAAGLLNAGTGPIEAFLPVMLLAILFGLSMDYQVFLVSRMHEAWLQTRDNHRAVRIGQRDTGRVITAAATIMIFVFGSFILGGQRVISEFGIGLSAAVFLDAFVLRTVLVPSLMHLIGPANWWLPDWLGRTMPHLSVEGQMEPEPIPEQA